MSLFLCLCLYLYLYIVSCTSISMYTYSAHCTCNAHMQRNLVWKKNLALAEHQTVALLWQSQGFFLAIIR